MATISWTDRAGKGHRPRRYCKTRKEARDALKGLLQQAEQGIQLAQAPTTLGAYLARWLEASARPSLKPKTYQGYESIVRVRIVPRIGALKLAQVTPPVVQQLYVDLASEGLSPRSAINTHRCLHRALEQALKWGLIARNPCDAVDAPRAARTEMRVLDRSQVDILVSSTTGDREHALYVLAVTTGLRQGELLGLRWSDIDFDVPRLSVQRALQPQRGKGLVFVETKTSRSRREITLSQHAVRALKRHRTRQLEERLLAGSAWTDAGVVFATVYGLPTEPTGATKRFKAALLRAGLPLIRFHDLRHTAATLLFSQGMHAKIVGDMLGHSTITLTLDTYSHVIPSMHATAANTMDALLSS